MNLVLFFHNIDISLSTLHYIMSTFNSKTKNHKPGITIFSVLSQGSPIDDIDLR